MIETSRLRLRTFKESDIEHIYNWERLEEVARYTEYLPIQSISKTRQFLNRYIDKPIRPYDLSLIPI